MPIYAVTLPQPASADPPPLQRGPIAVAARLLAEFHTSMNIAGLRAFSGNLDRFLVFCFLMRTSLSRHARDGTISVHSAALSLGRPFETVRRHISALIEAGICERTATGVTLSAGFWARADTVVKMRFGHDCFVRLLDDGVAAGIFPVEPRPAGTTFDVRHGVCAACDLMLALIDSNRAICPEAIDLAIFSAVLHANGQRFAADPQAMIDGCRTLLPRHAVRVAEVARALSLPDTTVRRRVAPMSGPDGLYIRSRAGLLIAPRALRPCEHSGPAADARHGSIRLIIKRAVAAGLPLDRPGIAYRDGRPPSPQID